MSNVQPGPDAPRARTAVSRRALAAGAAWSVPAIAVATAAPAMAASCGGNIHTVTYNYTGAAQSITIPAGACVTVLYEVTGGNGGFAALLNGVPLGHGARLSGSLKLGTTTSTKVAKTLDLIVGGGGLGQYNASAVAGAWGYGSGGSVPAPVSSTLNSAFPSGSGGGGSAILFGNLPVVVAGGGGGLGSGFQSGSGGNIYPSNGYNFPASSGMGGNGGYTSGTAGSAREGGVFRVTPAGTLQYIKGGGGAAAAGASGGAGGTNNVTINAYLGGISEWARWPGSAGGAHGTGTNGGGNGGNAAYAQSTGGTDGSPASLTNHVAAPGAGGGGWAGGGGGGTTFLFDPDSTWGNACATVAGGGGGGSSWADTSGTSGITVATVGADLNPADTKDNYVQGNGDSAGGYIKLTYWT